MSPLRLPNGTRADLVREDYDSLVERINFSTLKWMQKSPAHYRHVLTAPDSDTDAKKVGRVVHLAAFEPERFLQSIAVWDGGTRRGKDWDAFCEKYKGRELLTENEFDRCMAIQKAVREDSIARQFVNSGKGEVTVLGELRGEKSQLTPCKGRLDFVGAAIADLKVTKDGSPEGFPRQVVEYRYHTQSAWYVDLFESATGERKPYYIVAVEGAAPHVVTVYQVPDFLLRLGRAEYQGWLDKLASCRETSSWPGYVDRPIELELPEWELKKTLMGEIDALDLEIG